MHNDFSAGTFSTIFVFLSPTEDFPFQQSILLSSLLERVNTLYHTLYRCVRQPVLNKCDDDDDDIPVRDWATIQHLTTLTC